MPKPFNLLFRRQLGNLHALVQIAQVTGVASSGFGSVQEFVDVVGAGARAHSEGGTIMATALDEFQKLIDSGSFGANGDKQQRLLRFILQQSLSFHERCFRWGSLGQRSEEHTSELQSHGLISYAVFC